MACWPTTRFFVHGRRICSILMASLTIAGGLPRTEKPLLRSSVVRVCVLQRKSVTRASLVLSFSFSFSCASVVSFIDHWDWILSSCLSLFLSSHVSCSFSLIHVGIDPIVVHSQQFCFFCQRQHLQFRVFNVDLPFFGQVEDDPPRHYSNCLR
jgi:hypothetical protein